MGNTLKRAIDEFKGFGPEIINNIRQRAADRISDAEFDERIVGIEKATAAMTEAEVDKEVIIRMLQKYWDLRLSEAKTFVEQVGDYNSSI